MERGPLQRALTLYNEKSQQILVCWPFVLPDILLREGLLPAEKPKRRFFIYVFDF